MSEQRGTVIGECGHPRPLDVSGWVGPCACERPSHRELPGPDYLAQLCAAVEQLARSRHLLAEVIDLADEVTADTITNEELRQRLAALADRAQRASTSPMDPRPAAG